MPSQKKALKILEITNAIRKSNTATRKGARAKLLKGGTIEYSIEAMTKTGKKYRSKVSFSDILGLLHGGDMRYLHGKYSRGKS